MAKQAMRVEIETITAWSEVVGEEWKVYLLLEGQAEVQVEHQIFSLSQDQFFLVNADESLTIQQSIPTLFLTITLQKSVLRRILSQELATRFMTCPQLTESASVQQEFLQRLHQIMSETLAEEESSAQVFESALHLYNFLVRHFQLTAAPTAVNDSRITRIKQYIEENYREELSLTELAEHENSSYSYLSRFFKAKTGWKLTKYVTHVRLRHALDDLLYTQKPLVEVSIDNGFLNPKTFTRNFKAEYGVLPSEYRKQHANKKRVKVQLAKRQVLTKSAALKRLASYLIENDLEDSYRQTEKQVVLDLTRLSSQTIPEKEWIVNIGLAENLLLHETQQQLAALTDELQFSKIRLVGLGHQTLTHYQSQVISPFKNLLLLFTTCQKFQLTPIIQLTSADLTPGFFTAVDALTDYFSFTELSNWQIELAAESILDLDQNQWQQLLSTPFQRFGLYFSKAAQQKKDELATAWQATDSQFHFLTLDFDFYREYTAEATNFETTVAQLQELLAGQLKPAAPVYLNDWNTIAGNDQTTVGTFFRAALIAAVLQKEMVQAGAFWLSIEAKSLNQGKNIDNCLSLYMYGLVRRPAYFALHFLQQLQGAQLYADPNCWLYQKNEQLILLLANPKFMDPTLSVSQNLVHYQSLLIDCTLQKLPHQSYVVRRYLLDKDHGGVYNEWLKAGGRLNLDHEALRYLEDHIRPEYSVRSEVIQAEQLTFSRLLSLNSLSLITLQPLS